MVITTNMLAVRYNHGYHNKHAGSRVLPWVSQQTCWEWGTMVTNGNSHAVVQLLAILITDTSLCPTLSAACFGSGVYLHSVFYSADVSKCGSNRFTMTLHAHQDSWYWPFEFFTYHRVLLEDTSYRE